MGRLRIGEHILKSKCDEFVAERRELECKGIGSVTIIQIGRTSSKISKRWGTGQSGI
jgi:hypothetical protein